jgi:Ca2+/Na+ antiporter
LTAAGSGRVLGTDLWSGLTLAVISLIGLSAFLYPLFLTKAPHEGAMTSPHSEDAPLIFGLVLALTLLLFVLELARQGMNAKTASALATLMMIAAALRIPTLPAGATDPRSMRGRISPSV